MKINTPNISVPKKKNKGLNIGDLVMSGEVMLGWIVEVEIEESSGVSLGWIVGKEEKEEKEATKYLIEWATSADLHSSLGLSPQSPTFKTQYGERLTQKFREHYLKYRKSLTSKKKP